MTSFHALLILGIVGYIALGDALLVGADYIVRRYVGAETVIASGFRRILQILVVPIAVIVVPFGVMTWSAFKAVKNLHKTNSTHA